MDSSRQPLISVIVCTIGRSEMLLRCLRSLLATEYRNYEILVVDQEPGSRLEAAIAAELPDDRIRYFHLPTDGLSPARNFGIRHSSGEILAFIDDDAVASPEWLSAIAEAFRQQPSPGMIGGRLVPVWPDGEPPAWYPASRRYLLGVGHLGDKMCVMPESCQPIGANMAGRREAILEANGFDERLGFRARGRVTMLAGADSLLSLRVRRAGWPVWYQPRMSVQHFVSRSKLTKAMLLRRNFWEGISFARVRYLLDGRGFPFGVTSRQHLWLLVRSALRVVWPQRSDETAPRERRMLALTHLCYSAGMLLELMRERRGHYDVALPTAPLRAAADEPSSDP